MDGGADAWIGAAATEIAGHGGVDIVIGGSGIGLEQGYCIHDLTGLTVAALGDLFVHPCLLDGMKTDVVGEAVNGSYRACYVANQGLAGAHCFCVDDDCAGAAKAGAAAEFRALDVEDVSERPEQRHVGLDLDGMGNAVDDDVHERLLLEYKGVTKRIFDIMTKNVKTSIMDDDKTEQRRALILQEAFNAFAHYGFKRTTMDDIARAAGISRPALYLVYRNKADIFRACMLSMMEEMRVRVAACFAKDVDIVCGVERALDEGILRPHREISATTHGAEIFDTSHEFAADLFLAWMRTMEEEIASGLEAAEKAGQITFASAHSPATVASLMLDAVEGMKSRNSDMDLVAEKIRHLVRLMIGPLIRQVRPAGGGRGAAASG